MEQKIMDVLKRMQELLCEKHLKELQNVLRMVFVGCEIIQEKQELRVSNNSWSVDLEDFLMSKALEGKSPNTVERYRYELQRLLSYVNKAVVDISDGDISNYMRAYKAIRQISNQTLKNVRAVYSGFFAWLRDRDRIRKNPMVLVEDIKVEKKIKKPFTDEERELLLRNCETLRDKAMMEFLYSTAVRVSELVALNRNDIRWTTKDLTVFGKGSKERTVYLNDRTNMYMKEYLETRTDDNEALFVSIRNPHERLSKRGIENIIKRTGRRAGVDKAHPHRFRRTAATNALNRGMPVQEVAQLLGHAKLETTMVYCSVDQAGVKYHHQKYLSA
jgi:integrase/recombinase XerD